MFPGRAASSLASDRGDVRPHRFEAIGLRRFERVSGVLGRPQHLRFVKLGRPTSRCCAVNDSAVVKACSPL